jgi:hypothetical protein
MLQLDGLQAVAFNMAHLRMRGYRVLPRIGIAEEIYRSDWFSMGIWLIGDLVMAPFL